MTQPLDLDHAKVANFKNCIASVSHTVSVTSYHNNEATTSTTKNKEEHSMTLVPSTPNHYFRPTIIINVMSLRSISN